jgi:protein-S-isoprenylcysteine O-methyltransferase Ste14
MTSIRRSIVVSVLFTLFGGPALVLVLMPWYITHFRMPAEEPLARIVAAAALIGIGLVPLMDSIVRFIVAGRGTLMPAVPTEHLVVSGLYRYVRNPMYVGVLTALAGEVLLFWNRSLLVYLATVWLGFHLFVCFYEEPRLSHPYSSEYARFKQNVPRWIPRLTPWHPVPVRGDE